MKKLLKLNRNEFGYELVMMTPHAYYLHRHAEGVQVSTINDMRPFYFFLDDEDFISNEYIDRKTTQYGAISGAGNCNTADCDKPTEWECPDYKSKFESVELKTNFEKPLLMISNKYTSEWDRPPTNFLSLQSLEMLFNGLSTEYDIIYNRPLTKNITEDNQDTFDLGDYELVRKYNNVHDINKLLEVEDYSFNELLLILLAKSENKISVQGGTSIVSSLTGGLNFIYAERGNEVNSNSYNRWYRNFSDAEIFWQKPKTPDECDKGLTLSKDVISRLKNSP
jgi:hypothetical protein